MKARASGARAARCDDGAAVGWRRHAPLPAPLPGELLVRVAAALSAQDFCAFGATSHGFRGALDDGAEAALEAWIEQRGLAGELERWRAGEESVTVHEKALGGKAPHLSAFLLERKHRRSEAAKERARLKRARRAYVLRERLRAPLVAVAAFLAVPSQALARAMLGANSSALAMALKCSQTLGIASFTYLCYLLVPSIKSLAHYDPHNGHPGYLWEDPPPGVDPSPLPTICMVPFTWCVLRHFLWDP